MEKLELKHAAPYLPYKVAVIYQLNDVSSCYPVEQRSSILCADNIAFVLKYCKLKLHSLSDLTLLINNEFANYRDKKDYDQEVIDLFCEENLGHLDELDELDINHIPYNCMEYMVKNHYDFNDLIKKGLAIDINTLNK